jgi:hypothetical protein
VRPYLKNNWKTKTAGDLAQVIEKLPTTFMALISNPITTNGKRKKDRNFKILPRY